MEEAFLDKEMSSYCRQEPDFKQLGRISDVLMSVQVPAALSTTSQLLIKEHFVT